MPKKSFYQKSVYLLIIFLLICTWLVTTESGLIAACWLIKWSVPGKLTTAKIEGKIIHCIKITDLHYESSLFKASIQEFTLKPTFSLFMKHSLMMADFEFKGTQLIFKNNILLPMSALEGKGNFTLKSNGQFPIFQAEITQGYWFERPLQANLNFELVQKNFYLPTIRLSLGENVIKISPAASNAEKIDWLFHLKEQEIHLESQGFLEREPALKRWKGEINKIILHSTLVGDWNLKEPTSLILGKDQYLIAPLQLVHSPDQLIARGSFQWDQHRFSSTLDIPFLAIQHPYLQGGYSFQGYIHQEFKRPLTLKANLEIHPGTLALPIAANRVYKLIYQRGYLNTTFENNNFTTQFHFNQNAKNLITGELKASFSSWNDFATQPIQGNFQGKWEDPHLFYSLIPDLGKFRGALYFQGDIQGNFKKPLLQLEANTKETSFIISKPNLKIHDFNLQILGKIPGLLNIQGSGFSGTGQFHYQGTSQWEKTFTARVKISGEKIEVYHTPTIQVIATPDVMVDYANSILQITGTVQIPSANITLNENKSYAVLSKDVVLVDGQQSIQSPYPLQVIPNLYVVIENNLHFKGYGIDGIIGGKIAIEERADGLLTGNGRLTIKEGKYRLQGATRYIHRGRLLFPPGTLLVDPILDIRIGKKHTYDSAYEEDIGIYVQGTLQKPLLQPYSTANLQSTEILSRLGFGSTEAAGDEKQRQLLAQTAFLLAGSANPLIDTLQTNLGLEEFNIESGGSYKSFDTQGGTDTVLVMGKSLSRKVYLQYLQSVLEPVATIRLKYFLNRYFTTSIETGTEGIGGDITFSMEKN